MANPKEPDGTSWAKHQHVIMAIMIRSMNDFEPADGATPAFYGSNTPFKITKFDYTDKQLSLTKLDATSHPLLISGTNVIQYRNIKPGTPILLVTRVRDIEPDKLTNLDKRYIVCSNVAFKNGAITATITDKYDDWKGLPVLINNTMENKKDIFKRQKEDNSRLEKLIENARKSVAALKKSDDTKEPVKTAAVTPVAVKRVDNPPIYQAFPSASKYFNSDAYKEWVTRQTRDTDGIWSKNHAAATAYFADNINKAISGKVNNAPRKISNAIRGKTKGGSPNDDLTSLNKIVSNNEDGFKKYVYFLLTQPFYFKLNALTPTMLTKIKSYILSSTNISPNTSFDQHILQPFTNFAYVEYTVNIPNDTDLSKDGDLAKDHELIKNLSDLIAHSISTDTVSNFASQIKKDTNNYKQLINTAPRTYYIHIFRFIELIEKQIENTQTLYPSATSPLPEHVTIFIGHALNKIYEHMQQVTPIFDLLSSVDTILIQDKLKSQQQKLLKVYIDDYVSSQNRTDIITYLKINSTEPEGLSGNKSWNQRYDIRLKQSSVAGEAYQKFNAMILGYKMYPAPFYYVNDKKKTIVAVGGLDRIVTYKTPVVGGLNEIEKVNNYDKYYLFGNYENIFPLYNINDAKVTNLENAKNMTAIIEQICTHNKPVFLLGYGASGSGKTSSLIYFNKGKNEDEKNGIVIHLCKKIIEKLSTTDTDKIMSVKLVIKEFYETSGLQTNTSADYIFDLNLKKPTSKPDEPKHGYHVNMNEPVVNFETMGQVLKQLVDVDRYVKATPNNPQSSRSHVLVFIQFCSDDAGAVPIRNLIVGDFAGKENVFQCADTDTVVAFLNKKVENGEIVKILNKKLPTGSADRETYTFYGAQLMQSGGDGYANDPVNELVDDKMLTPDELNNRRILQTSSGMLFDFEKPSNSINKAYINSPETYDLSKLIADQYAPIVIKYYFKDEPLNNSKIYDKLLNGKDKFDNVDMGIDIFNIYTKPAAIKTPVINDKRASLLQHLIFEDLFEADRISGVITDADIDKYKYNETKDIVTSAGSGSGNYQIQSAMQNISNMIADKDNLGIKLIDKASYPADIFNTSGSGLSNYRFTGSIKNFNAINTVLYKKSDNPVFNPIINPPKYFTITNIKNDILDKFTRNNTTWKIAGKKMFPYKDQLEFVLNKEKAIPIVKSFTISTMCEYFMTNRFKSLLPFFEKKQSNQLIETTQPIFYEKNTNTHNYVNEFKYILDSLNTPDNDLNHYIKLIDIYKKNITISQVRLKHGQKVCENRLIEGKYINSSLDQMRASIKYILNKKHENSDALFHSPDFIDMCLQSYCPSGINCFNTSSTDNAPESLIDEIYNHISPTTDKAQFYKDIVISVFGVFNVSRLADNPPPVPYIDINHLKQIYYNNNSEYSEKYPLLWALHELKEQIKKLPEQNIKMLPLIEYISEEEDDKDKNLPLIDALTNLINVAIGDYEKFGIEDILSKARKDISYYFMNTLKEIIEAIDIHNAASTIGTLEFLDQLAKFNSVNNLCYKNVVLDTTPERNLVLDTTPYLDDSEYDKYFATAINLK